uniref:Uncharacterized protein n=1 Tax=Caenorhabditis japonica TaxID=281687 RepID=A0A8R1I720_CAEJA
MTSLLLLLIATPLVLAEPMLYMFPTNPELHPQSMYPNQQFMRGKVRDLPDSGVIYLKRIRPIEDEAIKGSVVELSVEKISQNSNTASGYCEPSCAKLHDPFQQWIMLVLPRVCPFFCGRA